MKPNKATRKRPSSLGWFAATLLVLATLCPRQALAQVPPRFYWKTLSNARGVPLIVNAISGNTNPFDPSHAVNAGANVDAVLAVTGYAHNFPVFGRAAMAAVLLPVGKISGDVIVAGETLREQTAGFGDPMIEFDINLIGPRAQMSIPDALRYEPKFSLDFLGDLAFPIGEYDDDQSLNMGQHRWYGRLGLPMIGQLGPWVPGRRTTIELLPAVWLFGTNDDYVAGKLETKPMFQLDGHLTRDLVEHLWASLDAAWYIGGKATVNGMSGDKLNNVGVGFTLGYGITDNLNLTFGYKSTVADKRVDDLRMSGFMASLVFGWHPLLEGSKRLRGEK